MVDEYLIDIVRMVKRARINKGRQRITEDILSDKPFKREIRDYRLSPSRTKGEMTPNNLGRSLQPVEMREPVFKEHSYSNKTVFDDHRWWLDQLTDSRTNIGRSWTSWRPM